MVFENIKPMDEQHIGLHMIIDKDELLGISIMLSEKKIFI